jgi:hypothetical protein
MLGLPRNFSYKIIPYCIARWIAGTLILTTITPAGKLVQMIYIY